MRSNWLFPTAVAATLGLLIPACGDDGDTNDPTPTPTTTNTGTGDCGNGMIDGTEECDGADLGSQTCVTQGLDDGTLACSAGCTFDLSGCTGCGNGTVEAGEQCEPPNTATCDASCQNIISSTSCDEADSYDTDCETATSGQWCWDGGDGGELFCGCDPSWGDVDCTIAGYEFCNAATMMCEPIPDCGSDSNEDNDDEASATTFSTSANGAGSVCKAEVDYFKFTAGNTAALLTLSWTSDGATDLDLDVTDCAGTTIDYAMSSDLAQEVLPVRGLEAGSEYCVMVSAYTSPNGGTGDMDYTLAVEDLQGCMLDSQCPANNVCPFTGDMYGICTTDTPANAGCGDAVAGDNETSGDAETLTSGATITEGTCDGEPDNPPDVDWFTFTVATGDTISLEVDQAGSLTPGDVDMLLYNSDGDIVAASATTEDPELIAGPGLAAGAYYAVVYYYDNAQGASSDTYDITLTLTAGSGCATRDDCVGFFLGECTSNVCVDFPGNENQQPGEFCDSADDCDPDTTGTSWTSSPCVNVNGDRAGDNVCSIDCTGEGDCTPHGMHCAIIDETNVEGLCLAPCLTDDDCGGGTCTVATGICGGYPQG